MLLINICGRLLLLVVALVAAAPSPRQLEIREPAAAQPPQCSPSLALVLVRALKASQFCTSYLHLTTKTVSKTATTSTAIVTEYIETVVEQNAAPTAYATKVVSSACNCYVTAPTTTIYVQTVVSTAKATSTLSFKTTVTSVVKTITQGPPRPGTSTVFTTVPGATDTVTTTTVVDSTVPGTTTRTEVITPTAFVSGLQFIRTGTYMSYCKPQGYLAVQLAPAALSSEDTFQFCASLCAQTSGCTQIFVGTPNPQNAGEQALCFIGGVAPVAPRHLAARVPELSKTYWTASDISCNQVLVNGVGTWYDRYYGAVATMTEE
ncbi:unnamed protein product [Parascedosporium putredinis]|uniref:Apple domain-containing protein n=1 Tax=Parascedosporium putredinis TaxID=1442378 RepID=A0A9P1MBU8_9PEZI|nr:unnamed protein product [Parascedosporium putredinis]CAI7996481.1 unnamed protein product [Parascedosporium putredinis]